MQRSEKWVDEIIELAVMCSNGEKVNHPSHYNKGIETIDYIESWDMNFNIGNVIKYATRAEHKDNKLEDLEKAKWYIEREIENTKKAKGNI